jgi:hypothetical protein
VLDGCEAHCPLFFGFDDAEERRETVFEALPSAEEVSVKGYTCLLLEGLPLK